MRCRSGMFAFLLVLVSIASIPADEVRAERTYEWGDTGELEFPWFDNRFVIWHIGDSSRASVLTGIVTEDTDVKIIFPFNESLLRTGAPVDRLLSVVSGRKVVVYATITGFGQGEGSRDICQALTVYVLPRRGEPGYPW